MTTPLMMITLLLAPSLPAVDPQIEINRQNIGISQKQIAINADHISESRKRLDSISSVATRNGIIMPLMAVLEVIGFVGLVVAFRSVNKARQEDMKQILIDRELAKSDRTQSAIRELRMDSMAADIAAALVYIRAQANLSGIAADDNTKKLESLKKQIDSNTNSIIEKQGYTPAEIVLPTMNVTAESVTVTQNPPE